MGSAEKSSGEDGDPYPDGPLEGGSRANPQPPKSRPKSPERLKCPECGGTRLFRDGLRRLPDGSAVQRWLCRKCGYRFSESRVENSGGKDLKRGSALRFNRRVGVWEGQAKNSARGVVALEEKADAESRAAGATAKPCEAEIQGKIVEFAWWLKSKVSASTRSEIMLPCLSCWCPLGLTS